MPAPWAIAPLVAAGWATGAFETLKRLGAIGLFAVAVGDSSFIFFPFGNDLLLISLVASGKGVASASLYVAAATIGSLVGVVLVDLAMRKVGEEGLEHFVKPRTVDRLRCRLESRAGLFVFAGTLVPPPFPFTAVVLTASALRTSRCTLLLAVGLGRLVRYTIEAFFALRYGERIMAVLDAPIVAYAVWGLVGVAVVGSVISVRKWLGGRRDWSRRPANQPG